VVGSHAETPKAAEAFALWRWYSREITADLLRFYNVDIHDWYSGRMSSSRLIILLEGLPEESMFQTWAVRGGDWTLNQYIQVRIANELALSRADGKGYMPNLLKSPMQAASEEAAEQYRKQRHSDTLKQLERRT
jgi:hypothetical protein